MRRVKLGFVLFGLGLFAASGCAAEGAEVHAAGAPPRTMQVLLHDHLGFGARLERVSLVLDGESTYEVAGARPARTDLVVTPGAHTFAVLAEVSEPCGILDEPRMRLSVRALESLVVGEASSTLDVDFFASAATSDPAHLIAVRFTGEKVALGAKGPADAPVGTRCDAGDELCVLDARIDRARTRGDDRTKACYLSHRDELRRWRDAVEDSYAAVSRPEATTKDAENAQLRARYAESKLRSAVMQAGECASEPRVVRTPPTIERKVDAFCPVPDVTATRELR